MAAQRTTSPTINKLDDLDELAEMDGLPDRFEVIRGEIVEMSPTGWDHSSIALRIGTYVNIWLFDHPIGDTAGEGVGIVLSRSPLVTLAPDMTFVSAERLAGVHDRTRMPELTPDLVVEVNSPTDRASGVLDKVMTYLEYGVRLVWVVDPPRQTVSVYHADRPGSALLLHIGDTLDGEDVLPGFQLPLSQIFDTNTDS
jgi:Uma2 family endonuclease